MNDAPNTWTEENSQLYEEIAPVVVPARAEQIAALLILLPFDQHEPFRAVELGCGVSALSSALLDCFPNASVLALDGSPAMRARAADELSRFGARARVEAFDLASTEWLPRMQSADCVLSSLALHPLSSQDKQSLFLCYNPTR